MTFASWMTMDKQSKQDKGKDMPLEGEGSYTGSRRYREGVEKSVAAGKTDELARKAQKAYDGKEGDALRKAEAEAKKGKKPQRK